MLAVSEGKEAGWLEQMVRGMVYTKTFECVDHNKLENSKRDGLPDYLT